jgi:hypothetical protein
MRFARVLLTASPLVAAAWVLTSCLPACGQDITSNLRGHWRLDDTSGSTAVDSSGQGANGTYTGTMQKGKTGRVGTCVGFSDNGGTTDRLSLPYTVLNGQSNITFSFWLRTTNTSYHSILSANNASNDNEFFVFIEGGQLKVRYHNVANANVWNLNSPYDGDWHHIVVIANHTFNTTTVYQDGASLGTQAVDPGASLSVSSGGLFLAQDQDCVGGCFDSAQRLIGDLDQVRIYSRVLTSTEVGYLYRDGTPVGHWKLNETAGTSAADASGLGNTGTVTGTASWTAAIHNNGFSFNGSTKIQASGLMGRSRDVSVAAWVNLTAADTNGAEVISLGDHFLLRLDAGSSTQALFYNGSTWTTVSLSQTFAGTGWHHFAAVFDDGSNSLKLYVDGAEAASLSTTASVNYSGLGSNTVIGRHGNLGTTTDFTGVVDDVRVYIHPLSAKEVGELYGLVGHWKLTETSGTTATDASSQGNNGTYTGGVTLNQSGPYPGAGAITASFDGTNDYVAAGNQSCYDITENVTVAAWIKVNAFDKNYQTIVAKGDTSWRLARDVATNNLAFACNGLTTTKVVSNANVNDGRWHHVVGTYNGSQLRIYIDGQLDNTAAATGSISTNSQNVRIGENSESTGRQFNGLIHDVRLYNRAISGAEIARLYGLVGYWDLTETSGTTATDSTLIGNNATHSNGAAPNAAGPYPGAGAIAAVYDGTDDVTYAPSSDSYDFTESIAVAAWVRFDQAVADQTEQHLLVHRSDWGAQEGFQLLVNQPYTSNLLFRVFNGTTYADAYWDASTIQADEWHHLAATYDGSTIRLYVDGQLVASTATSIVPKPDVGGNLYIADHHDGRLHDVRVYNRALTDAEIEGLYGLVGHWVLGETSGTTAADSTLVVENGTYLNGVTLNVGGPKSGLVAAEFDGVNDYVTTANESSYDFTGAVAVAAWIKVSAFDLNYQAVLTKGTSAWRLTRNGSGNVMRFAANGLSTTSVAGLTAVDDGKWHHVAGVYDGSTLSLYIDGQLDNSASATGSISTNDVVVAIGRYADLSSTEWEGRIHDARVYNRAISAEEVQALHASGYFAGVKILSWVEIQ